MTEDEQYVADLIHSAVYSGLHDENDVQEMITDILEGEVDESKLRAMVPAKFQEKARAEATWPAITDCDRLDEAFAELDRQGIIALQNAGNTTSEGHEEVGAELDRRGRVSIKGYCFYHNQDLERVVNGGVLALAFGDLRAEKEAKRRVGELVVATMRKHGFTCKWEGDPEQRIEIHGIRWQRRYQQKAPHLEEPEGPGPAAHRRKRRMLIYLVLVAVLGGAPFLCTRQSIQAQPRIQAEQAH